MLTQTERNRYRTTISLLRCLAEPAVLKLLDTCDALEAEVDRLREGLQLLYDECSMGAGLGQGNSSMDAAHKEAGVLLRPDAAVSQGHDEPISIYLRRLREETKEAEALLAAREEQDDE